MTGRELRAVWYQGEAEAESCSAQDLEAWVAKHGREPDAFGLYRTELDGTQTHERDFPPSPRAAAFKALLKVMEWPSRPYLPARLAGLIANALEVLNPDDDEDRFSAGLLWDDFEGIRKDLTGEGTS